MITRTWLRNVFFPVFYPIAETAGIAKNERVVMMLLIFIKIIHGGDIVPIE
jgi:hypothetical protein